MRGGEATASWRQLLRAVLDGEEIRQEGRGHEPRDRSTTELVGYQTRWPMRDSLVRCPLRKLSRRFAAAESLWVISGSNLLEPVARHARYLRQFSDDGVTLSGAYGPRFVDQVGYAVDCLRADPCSRQAVVTLWRERPRPSRDVPCTVALQWLARGGRLHCLATMRSSDAWLGVPYDVWTFSCLSALVLARLGPTAATLGDLVLTAGSQHLYAVDRPAAEACAWEEGLLPPPRLCLGEVRSEAQLVDELRQMEESGE